MHKIIYYLSIFILLAILLSSNLWAAAGSSISGFIRDSKTGDALIGANIVLMGTSMGASSDQSGKYIIPKVIPGTYTLKVSYIGYEEVKIKVVINDGDNVKQDLKLEPVGIVGQEIVVTAQAYGQTQAINEQLSSNQIMNSLSSARIEELPDNTIAESVGRLPGVTVLRNGGEGNEVIIRGMSPKYNEIMIDGVQFSSADPNDRSADLSMISSNMLEGVQVSKNVNADMDADVIGGSVNFQLREAKVTQSGRPQFNLSTQGSYNNLPDAYHKFNNYKYVGSAEDRFFEDRLGVFAQVDVERKNLTSNEYGAIFTPDYYNENNYHTAGLNLYDIPRDRQRYNTALVLDYLVPDGKIKLTNFLSTGTTNIQNRGESFFIDPTPTQVNQHQLSLASSNSKVSIITNSLDYDQQLPIFHIVAKLSHTYSETKDPFDWTATFIQNSVGLQSYYSKSNLNPIGIPKAAATDLSQTFFNTFISNSSFSRQRALTASLDLDANANILDYISANLKIGGKFRYQTRDYVFEQFDGGGLQQSSATILDNLILANLGLPSSSNNHIPVTYFLDPSFSYGKFLGGDYNMIAPLNYGMLSSTADLLRNNQDYLAQNDQIAYGRNTTISTTNNYNGHENQSAFYVMGIINIGPQITIIPGVRYQNLQTTYTSARGYESQLSYIDYRHYDTTVIQNHGYWLPDVSIRYKPTAWCDIRLSYSNTIAYPDYQAIIPRIDVNLNGVIAYNNFQLQPTRSTNYDAYVSFYENTIGLFTVGGFLKQINNLIYPWTFYATGKTPLNYFPPQYVSVGDTANKKTFEIDTYVNDTYRINNYGAELDWQTHFWYLPGPLSGLVFNVNYTHIFSQAQYPFVNSVKVDPSNPRSSTIFVDTSFTARLLDQPDDIINLAFGFDYGGFSARVSMLYQANIFTGPQFHPSIRTSTLAYRRWDIALKQDLPWFGIQIYGDLNNINSAKDVSVIQAQGGVPQLQQDYGMTADFGIRLKL